MTVTTNEVLNMSGCPFCPENRFYTYKLLFNNCTPEDLIIYKTPNFIVLPDIAPLVEGHLLIISRSHYLCFGKLLNEHCTEFQELKQYITQLLTKTYAKPIFFEHGPALSKRAGCCIDHAHIHCLPVDIDISSTIHEKITRKRMSSIMELCDYSERRISYLFCENNLSTKYVYPLNKEFSILPSQYLRMVVAANLKLDKWDWREMINNENYKDTNKAKILKATEKLKKNLHFSFYI